MRSGIDSYIAADIGFDSYNYCFDNSIAVESGTAVGFAFDSSAVGAVAEAAVGAGIVEAVGQTSDDIVVTFELS